MMGPIVVATDGTPQSDAALRVASEIARHDHRHVWVLTVVPPLSVALPHLQTHWSGPRLEARREFALVQAREQVTRVTGCTSWPTVAEEGIPATVIAGFAADIHASLIIVGMCRHGIVDRLAGAATTLALVRQATTPVLVATPWLVWPPRRVVVAMDYSPASDAALHLANDVVAPDGMLEVVTVEERDRRWARAVPHEARRHPRLERVLARFSNTGSHRVTRRVLAGDPVARLLESVVAETADVIVTGPRQGEVLGRMLRGEVTSTLLQRAPCALLAVPEGAVAHLSATGASSGTSTHDRLYARGGGDESTPLHPSDSR